MMRRVKFDNTIGLVNRIGWTDKPVTFNESKKAAMTVASNSTGVADCKQLLEMLGIDINE